MLILSTSVCPASARATARSNRSPLGARPAGRPVAGYALPGYAAVAEVSLGLWEAAYSGGTLSRTALDPSQLAVEARQACKGLHRFARSFPSAEAYHLLCSGRLAWLERRPRKASNAWKKGINVARRSGVPYEEARSHLELGLRGDPLQRAAHLAAAGRLLKAIGARADL